MSVELEKLATVLEKTALYLDALEGEKSAAIQAEREKLAEVFKEQYEEITGEPIDEEILAKLANADVDILSAFGRLTDAGSNSGDLGSPGEPVDPAAPMNKKEASEAADQRFLDFCMSE